MQERNESKLAQGVYFVHKKATAVLWAVSLFFAFIPVDNAPCSFCLTWFRDAADAYIDFRDFVPCRVVYDAGLGQVEDALESTDSIGGVGAVDAVCGDAGDGGVILGDTVFGAPLA